MKTRHVFCFPVLLIISLNHTDVWLVSSTVQSFHLDREPSWPLEENVLSTSVFLHAWRGRKQRAQRPGAECVFYPPRVSTGNLKSAHAQNRSAGIQCPKPSCGWRTNIPAEGTLPAVIRSQKKSPLWEGGRWMRTAVKSLCLNCS